MLDICIKNNYVGQYRQIIKDYETYILYYTYIDRDSISHILYDT